MNASYSSESPAPSSATDWGQGSRQTPSVPISVYRELATELKATQALVDSLTQQNQQLGQQNLYLRQEMLKFATSAAHLKQVVDSGSATAGPGSQATAYPLHPIAVEPPRMTATEAMGTADGLEEGGQGFGGVAQLTNQVTQVFGYRAKATPEANKPMPPRTKRPQPRRLYMEERLDPSRPGRGQDRHADLSGLWLAATILLIVVSAFGAGFLIMRPLLNTSR